MGVNVFQGSELVEPYWVASLIDLEENSNFCFFNNIFVDVDVEELNVVLSSNEQAQVDEDDDSCRTLAAERDDLQIDFGSFFV